MNQIIHWPHLKAKVLISSLPKWHILRQYKKPCHHREAQNTMNTWTMRVICRAVKVQIAFSQRDTTSNEKTYIGHLAWAEPPPPPPTSLYLFKWALLFHMLMRVVVLAQIQEKPSIKLKKVYTILLPSRLFTVWPLKLKDITECHHTKDPDPAMIALLDGVVFQWQSGVTTGLIMSCVSLPSTRLAAHRHDLLYKRDIVDFSTVLQ